MLIKQSVPEGVGPAGLAAALGRSAQEQIGLSAEDEVFKTVLAAEHDAIEERRKLHNRSAIKEYGSTAQNGKDRPVYNTTGVALSGGGIRSAAFCLGALQSLGSKQLIGGVDYLSSVSGGGYIGASMTVCMAEPIQQAQEFLFGAL